MPILAKVGGAVEVGKSVQTRMPGEDHPSGKTLQEDEYRGIEIFPPRGSSHGQVSENTWYDDDGISRQPNISSFTVRYAASEDRISVSVAKGCKGRVHFSLAQLVDIHSASWG